jgi:hypothetical protein
MLFRLPLHSSFDGSASAWVVLAGQQHQQQQMTMQQQLPVAALALVDGTKLVRRASHVALESAARALAVLLSSGSTSRRTGTGVLLLFDKGWFYCRTHGRTSCSCMLDGWHLQRESVANAAACVQNVLELSHTHLTQVQE